MNKYEPLGRKLDLRSGRIDLSHGSGGRAMARLIADVFHKAFDNEFLRAGNDQSAFDIAGGRMVMTMDGYVVSPLFFPGGDIGDLAVNGTINDIAMAGAKPLYMSASFIIEEGFPLADLARIAQTMGDACARPMCRSSPATPRLSSAARLMACSSPRPASASSPRGSVSRATGRAPATSFCCRARLAITASPSCRSGRSFVRNASAFRHRGAARSRRGHGRGGWRVDPPDARSHPRRLGGDVNEIAHQSRVGVRLEEAAIPVRPQVAAACELLGLDPLFVANEGSSWRSSRPRRRKESWPRCARIRLARTARGSARRSRTIIASFR